jgi:hypothetical protein
MNSAVRALCICACLSALPLALAACQGETAQQSTAEGEVLPGSASDAMLPYDTVRSQPPLAPVAQASGKARTKAGDDGESEAARSEGADEAAGTPTGSAAQATTAPAAQ